ncbi:MAG: hypothetical protein EBU10_07345 [Alphaproteobacteria bacterium]|nr:hypothetical protein [Alphaproteobacteria bacterium]
MIADIADAEAITAKQRECPERLINHGLMKQPKNNPMKCAEPSNPISVAEKPNFAPDKASNGPSEPLPTCNSNTEINNADKEISTFM